MTRKLAVFLLVSSLLLGAARLFTGIVYGSDSPMAYLVLKRAPDFRMERAEAGGAPVEDEIILDTEETKLSYDWIYLGLMRTVPVAVPIMVTVSALLLALGRRRAREV